MHDSSHVESQHLGVAVRASAQPFFDDFDGSSGLDHFGTADLTTRVCSGDLSTLGHIQ